MTNKVKFERVKVSIDGGKNNPSTNISVKVSIDGGKNNPPTNVKVSIDGGKNNHKCHCEGVILIKAKTTPTNPIRVLIHHIC